MLCLKAIVAVNAYLSLISAHFFIIIQCRMKILNHCLWKLIVFWLCKWQNYGCTCMLCVKYLFISFVLLCNYYVFVCYEQIICCVIFMCYISLNVQSKFVEGVTKQKAKMLWIAINGIVNVISHMMTLYHYFNNPSPWYITF